MIWQKRIKLTESWRLMPCSAKIDRFLNRLVMGDEKFMFIWWDCKGAIFYQLLLLAKWSILINIVNNLTIWRQQLKKNIRFWPNGKVFHYNNVRFHSSMQMQRKLKVLKWDILLHWLYSSDIAPSDYYLFRSLRNSLNSRKFTFFTIYKTTFLHF